jgi:hypothetical protein
MAHIDLRTVAGTKHAIEMAREVFVQARFGSSERWVKITKLEARELVAELASDATPEQAEMFAGVFGTMCDKSVFLG